MTVTAPRQCARYGVCNDPRLIRGAQDEFLGRPLISPAVQCKGDSIMRPARSILDASFRYVLSFTTSVAMGFAMSAEPGNATVVRIRRDLRILNAQPH